MCPPILNTPPTSYSIPLGCPRALALSALLHASNLDWSSVSQTVVFMFQCCSLKSSQPRHRIPTGPARASEAEDVRATDTG